MVDVQDCDPMPIVVCLQRRLNDQSDIQQFLSHTLQYLNTWNGFSAEVENWMITSYEVEFGQRIGFGGLYVHSKLIYSCGSHTQRLFPPAEKSIKGFGTRLMLQLRFSGPTVALPQARRWVYSNTFPYLVVNIVWYRLFVEKLR